MSLGSNSLSEREEMPMTHQRKQQEKKQLITPAKVLIGVAILCILAMASYKVYTIAFPSQSESKIIQSHGKIIQNAESSSGKETSSQTGSQSSGRSRNNRPLGVATTVSKDIVSSNQGTGSNDDDEEPSDTNEENRRKKLMDKNKMADGSSTEGDSDEEGEEVESGDNEGQAVVWPNNGGSNGMPMVGKVRGLWQTDLPYLIFKYYQQNM